MADLVVGGNGFGDGSVVQAHKARVDSASSISLNGHIDGNLLDDDVALRADAVDVLGDDLDGGMRLSLADFGDLQRLLDEGRFSSMTEIAATEGIDLGQASRMSRLAQLAPDLIEAIALGRFDVGVSQLLRGKLSASLLAQREALVACCR